VGFLIVMVLLLVVMYVLMIRPQRQRQRDQQAMIDGAGVGDDILTSGGIYGTITRAEGDDVVVEIAEGIDVHMTRRGIAAVLPPEEDEEPEVVDGEPLEELEADEATVTAGEEAVTGRSDADTAAADRR
jgi:preprotein translocase subunit YajC